ncbi:sister chromatid separation protein [Diaporthe amygdali]|uniref:sister chromatid separation protein n=1 Tax=Phomopsis amygdali TaxID=1214568 RepID=UPI0022FF2300|nr:sister chromatid separation protein [Diaporthe amygdali]KAJ0121691.1 sister chromatid separation protein [Diaporthe amygdali]
MSDSEVDYLQPEFEPSSVTIPRLRSILVSQNVPYPATAKKAQLVEIFNDTVAPRARKLLAQRQKAKRSSMGITNIDGSQGYSVANQDLAPVPSSRRRAVSPRKSNRSFKQASEEPDHLPAQLSLSPRKRQARSASRQLAQSDTDTDSHYESRRSPRKTSRQPDLTPQPEVKKEYSDDDTPYQKHSAEPGAVFTSDNPFQSGSSPIPMATPSNRRRTAGQDSTAKKSTASSTRRRTDGPSADTYESAGYSKSVAVPVPAFTRPMTPVTPEPVFEEVEAGEEFTPDEQLALAQEDALRAQTAVAPVRQPRRSTNLATPFWLLITVLLGSYGAWYRQEKIAVGYCGAGRPAQEIIPRQVEYKDFKLDVPEWVFPLAEPECEPCPPHAYCYADHSVRCDEGFILKPHPLSANGLIPLPPTCEADSEKLRRVKAVADRAVEELRDRKAKFECGELVNENGQVPENPMVAVEDLKETVSEKRSKKLSKKEFDDLWTAALGEIEQRDEVVVEKKEEPVDPTSSSSGTVSDTYLASTSLARLPLGCAARRSVRLGLERHRLSIVSVIFSALSVLYGRSKYRTHRAISAQIPGLVDLVLERLSAQKELAYDDDGEVDTFLFLPNLRDDVLRAVHSISQRERIWKRVKAVIEQNSNVRTGQREGVNGEIGRAWEWIGPSGAGETGARRRRTIARSSMSPDDIQLGDETPFVDRAGVHKKWEEPGSRPIY